MILLFMFSCARLDCGKFIICPILFIVVVAVVIKWCWTYWLVLLCRSIYRVKWQFIWFVIRLFRQLTFVIEEPEKVYPTTDVIWTRFVLQYRSTFGLLLYAPVFREYFYQTLQQYYDDGVQYIEIRTLLPSVFNHFCAVYWVRGCVSQWVSEPSKVCSSTGESEIINYCCVL